MNLTRRKSYGFRLMVALSLLLCAVFGGYMYESACAAAWRLRYESGIKGAWARATIYLMDWLERDHCRKSEQWFLAVRSSLKQAASSKEDGGI